MNRVAGMLLLAAVGLVTGCDPGFTVRQVYVRPQKHPAVPDALQQVKVEVGRFHTLAGYQRYEPKVRVTNAAEAPIEIIGLELVTRDGPYLAIVFSIEAYPIRLLPGATQEVAVEFDLAQDLYLTFKEPAELRVHYIIGGNSETARASLAGKVQAP